MRHLSVLARLAILGATDKAHGSQSFNPTGIRASRCPLRPVSYQVPYEFLDCGHLERGCTRLLVLVPKDRLPPPVLSLAAGATLVGR
jgi:hypothetical protein